MQFEMLYILNHSVETLFTHVVDSVNSPKSWERFVALLVHSVSVHPYLYPHQQKVLKCLIFIHICDGCGMQFFESLYSLNHSQPSLLVWCWWWDYEGSAGHRTAANGRVGERTVFGRPPPTRWRTRRRIWGYMRLPWRIGPLFFFLFGLPSLLLLLCSLPPIDGYLEPSRHLNLSLEYVHSSM